MKSKSKHELSDWGISQLKKFNVPLPSSYSKEELKNFCPEIPVDFIDDYARKNDK